MVPTKMRTIDKASSVTVRRRELRNFPVERRIMGM